MLTKVIQNYQARKLQNEFGFGTGARSQPIDIRDHNFPIGFGIPDWQRGYDVARQLAEIWSKPLAIPINNQNGSSSCVGQGWGKYGSVKNYVERGYWTEISSHDIYAAIALPGGGAYGRDGGMLLVNRGAGTENDVPSYMAGQTPPDEAFMRSKPQDNGVLYNLRQIVRLKEIQSVNCTQIDIVAQAASLNNGMVMAVRGTNNGTWNSRFPKIGEWSWSHYVFVRGFELIDGKEYIKIQNSWGTACGDQGVQWLGKEWFEKNMVYDGWTATDRPNHIEREADYEKFNAIMWTTKLPEPAPSSPYTDLNWNFLQKKLGIFDITVGMHYNYEMAKKLREKYKL